MEKTNAKRFAAPLQNLATMGVASAFFIAAVSGVLFALALPRGVVTQDQALKFLIASLLVGGLAGLAMQSRWAMLLVPIVHILVLELARPQLLGPTVGALRLDETYGVLALILGRGLYFLVVVIPMMVGVYLGLVLANQLSKNLANGFLPWLPSLLVSGIVLALAIWIAIPASTPAILGADGKVLPGSIAELTKVQLGGQNQTILIRGYSTKKPVLLYLNGGPGQSGLPFTRVILNDLSKDFIIVDWDQRGTGKSYPSLEPSSSLTLDQAINDTIELTEYLRNRFKQSKIYVLGESWGSILGVLAAQRQPELFYAFIGSGQMVSPRETDRRIYQDILELADKTSNTQLAAKMQSYGQPPYADLPYANLFAMGQYDALYKPYAPSQAYQDLGNASGIGFYGVMASEYNLIEKFNVLRGLIDTFTIMYPQLQAIDFRQDVKRLEIPVYILDGTSELAARRDLMLEWVATLDAPKKQVFRLENAAHSVAFEQFAAFGKIMRDTILPETYSN